MFNAYFELGLDHVADIQAYDHIVFIVLIASAYNLSNWKRLLVLITAFTAGHSVTLALATLGVVQLNSGVIEFLIPVTIFITAVSLLFGPQSANWRLQYLMVMFFGLVHGLGFSNFLREMLASNSELFVPLLAFNVGIEAGQLLIVALYLLCSCLLLRLTKVNQREWTVFVGGFAAGIALLLMSETKFW